MAEITLDLDGKLTIARMRGLEKGLARVVSRAGGDAIRAMRAEASRVIRSKKRFKVARVNKSLRLGFPASKRDLSSLAWRMDVSGAPVPLIEFPHRQTRTGVTVSINVGKAPAKIPNGFIRTTRTGHEAIFTRVGKKRLPIREGFSTRVSDVFNDHGMVPGVYLRTQSVFNRSFARLLELELAK